MIWADIMIETLKKHWVKTIFGYPGWANMILYDRLNLCDDIEHILVRNEQAAAFAAQGHARTKKQLWVCFGTSWPWTSNLITGIMDAYMDSIPILIVTWQVPYPVMWTDAFQELDTIWTTMSIVKHSFVIDNVNKTEAIFDEAIKIATTGRPWPVLIDFPKDMSMANFTEKKELEKPLFYSNIETLWIAEKEIYDLTKALEKAKKPVLIIWQWIKFADAEEQLNEFARKIWIPVVSTLLAKWVIREDYENYLWMWWMHWFYHANLAMYNADLIINIWSRFDDRLVWTYKSFTENGKKVIHVDIDKWELNKVVKADIAIHADGKEFLNKILEKKLKPLEIDEWKQQINTWKTEKPFEEKTDIFSTKNALNTVKQLTENNLDRFIFTTDVWQHQMWCSQILKVSSTKHWLTSGWAWTMWFSIPTSMWAAISNPDKTIINIVWDWWVQMNIQELQVLAHHNLNIKIIIMNNSYLWMVRQWQDLFLNKNYAATPMTSPKYKELAEAYRMPWYEVYSEKELEEVLEKEFDRKWPCVIEAKIAKDEDNVFPMVPPWLNLAQTIVSKEDL